MKTDDVNLGKLATGRMNRDAIHIAVIPVEAAKRMIPGRLVKLNAEGKAVPALIDDAVGIVDPYLQAPVEVGYRFWMLLLPYTITSLRHEWTHPAFDIPKPVDHLREKAESVLKRYLSDYEPIGQTSIESILHEIEKGDLFVGDTSDQERARSHEADIKWAYTILTGKQAPDYISFRCAC